MSSKVGSSCPFHGFALDRVERDVPAGRYAVFAFGFAAYVAFFGTFLYAVGFVGNWVVPKSIDSGAPQDLVPSLLINAALLAVFVVQHTVMARPAFKRWVTRFIPASSERSTFVLAASAALALAFWQWRPLPAVIWDIESPALAWMLRGLSMAGYAIVLASSFMVSHWDLFGLRQVWLRLRRRPYRPVGFRLVGLYRVVRHPLMLGFLIAFWATPTMTVGHLLFSVLTSIYIAMGVWFEERDLVAAHGEDYLQYRRSVPALVPIPKRARSSVNGADRSTVAG